MQESPPIIPGVPAWLVALPQWQGSRYTGLVKYAQSSRMLPTTSAQAALGYLAQDLKGLDSPFAQQLQAVARTLSTPLTLFSSIYERPGIADDRESGAVRAASPRFEGWRDGRASCATLPGQMSPRVTGLREI